VGITQSAFFQNTVFATRNAYGGGIGTSADRLALSVSHTRMSGNNCTAAQIPTGRGLVAAWGGGLQFQSTLALALNNVTFTQNTASALSAQRGSSQAMGGALSVTNTVRASTIVRCTFRQNVATNLPSNVSASAANVSAARGGAVFWRASAALTVTDCVFESNGLRRADVLPFWARWMGVQVATGGEAGQTRPYRPALVLWSLVMPEQLASLTTT
jgi:hypothetical protein